MDCNGVLQKGVHEFGQSEPITERRIAKNGCSGRFFSLSASVLDRVGARIVHEHFVRLTVVAGDA